MFSNLGERIRQKRFKGKSAFATSPAGRDIAKRNIQKLKYEEGKTLNVKTWLE